MPIEKNTHDLLKLIINLLIIGLFIVITYLIISPFLFGFFWAVMVVIVTWSLMLKLQHRLFDNRLLASTIMTLLISLVFIIPFIFIITSITKNASFLIESVKNLSAHQLPELNWLASIPEVGGELHQKWLALKSDDASELINTIQPYIGTVVTWSVGQAANVGLFIFHGAIMITFSALLYLKGEIVTKSLYRLANRISSQYGSSTLTLAGQAIRAVALGVVVTALTLTFIGGLTLVLTDTPYPGLLTLLLFVCCVAQIGPLIIIIPCLIWQFWADNTAAGIVLIIVAIILTTLDSLMRAYLIKKGADLPFLLIFFGVIGGLLAFGVMGLFIGPVVLALSYKLIPVWVKEQYD